MTKVLAISGSLRQKSLNTYLLKAAQKYSPEGCEIILASIKDIPLYNSDLEKAEGMPKPVTELKQQILNTDGILISTPEYNHGIPGVLKNVIDWLTRPASDVPKVFGQRKVGVIGASPSRLGTAFAQTAWLPILRYLNTHTYFGNQLFVSGAHQIFDENGNIKDDFTKELIQKYVNDFFEFITTC